MGKILKNSDFLSTYKIQLGSCIHAFITESQNPQLNSSISP